MSADVVDFRSKRVLRTGEPEPTPDQIVQSTSIEALLSTAYGLSRRMEKSHPALVPDLRAQRDIITNEIIRRTTK